MGVQGRAPGERFREQSPPEAKTLLAFGYSIEATNLIFGNASHRRLYCLAKMILFKKSHLGMCMVARGHLITIKISPCGAAGGKSKCMWGGSCPLHPAGATHKTKST